MIMLYLITVIFVRETRICLSPVEQSLEEKCKREEEECCGCINFTP